MRTIDADALKDRLQALSYDDWNQGVSTTWANAYAECADMVEDMPTIEPERKKGQWIKKRNSDLLYCSECDLPNMHNWPYCERCGADMRGERQ